MSLNYEHLIGREFVHGRVDCYTMAREFYAANFGLEFPNYARPENWWDHGMNLYVDLFYDNGFRPVLDHPSTWRPTDAVLMAIRSKTANHCGIFVENGKILHHLWGRRSTVEAYRGLWRNSTLMVLRHKDIQLSDIPTTTVDLMELLPHALRQKLAAAVPPAGE